MQLEDGDERHADPDFLGAILRSQVLILHAVRESAARAGLTMQQFGVLRLLARRRSLLPMRALSDELRVSPPVITGIVDRLEKKGLVKRIGSLSDRRRTDVELTHEGRRLYQAIRKDYRSRLGKSLEKSLSPEERVTLARLLEIFAREISRQ